MSVVFSTQLTAAATLALAALAMATAVLAGLAFLKQSKEVGILLEQNQRDTDERRRSQAARVFLGAPPDVGHPVSPYARNASDFPIYDTQIWYLASRAGKITGPDNLGTIMPGEARNAEELFSGANVLRGTYLAFRDTEGRYWVRAPNGDFMELEDREHGLEEYVIPEAIRSLSALPPPYQVRHGPWVRGSRRRILEEQEKAGSRAREVVDSPSPQGWAAVRHGAPRPPRHSVTRRTPPPIGAKRSRTAQLLEKVRSAVRVLGPDHPHPGRPQ